MTYNLLLGDCLERLKEISDNSIDSIVTDPPYGLSFMGKKWDYDVPSVEIWEQCLRVLKPGGHLLSFAGTRTQHRMAVRIEDAGFEIRDMIAWVYGSGFPKSMDVSKAIDKAAGAEREVVGSQRLTGTARIKGQAAFGATSGRSEDAYQDGSEINDTLLLTAPATPEAQQWDGWGTALKPALEPITMARKPLSEGTVSANVLAYGTGGINIDGCRVASKDVLPKMSGNAILGGSSDGWDRPWKNNPEGLARRQIAADIVIEKTKTLGRWPANLIHDGSEEVLDLFPESNSARASGNPNNPRRGSNHVATSYGQGNDQETHDYRDSGSAARFFYCAKTPKSEKGENNNHPTVKPIKLMSYLCRLVTPLNGIILDPFMGSGSTGVSAMKEGFNFIGIELDQNYYEIASKRITEAAANIENLF